MHRFSASKRLAGALALAMLVPAGWSTTARGQVTSATNAAALIRGIDAGDVSTLEARLQNFHDPAQVALLRAKICLARLDLVGASAALDSYFATRDVDPQRRLIAWSLAVDRGFIEEDYGAAASAAEAWLQLPSELRPADEDAAMRQSAAVAGLLAAAPRQRIIGAAAVTVVTARDKAGLVRAPVTVNGIADNLVLDTGANLSLVTASTARKFGLRMIDGEVTVGSSSSSEVPTRLAIADRLVIAGMEFANVVFLVMDDAQLSFPVPGGYTMDGLIGFPVFRALGRVTFQQAGGFSVGSPRQGPPLDNLRIDGSDLYVMAKVNGATTALHIDTGASHSMLSSRFAAVHADMLGDVAAGTRRIIGAGAVATDQPTVSLQKPVLTLGDQVITIPQIPIITRAGKPERRMGRLGQDVLNRFESYTIDFQAMNFELGPPTTMGF